VSFLFRCVDFEDGCGCFNLIAVMIDDVAASGQILACDVVKSQNTYSVVPDTS
jgi:hypothetical protein